MTGSLAIGAYPQRVATRIMFFIAGMMTASWASIIPFIKHSLNVSDSVIGGFLLCLGAGAMAGMPLAGVGASRIGCRPVLLTCVGGFALLFACIPLVNSLVGLAIVLLLFGMLLGITDCAMNIQAVAVEKAASLPLMSGFHGFYSLGGMAGAVFMALQLTVHGNVLAACMLTSFVIIGLMLWSVKGLLGKLAADPGPLWVLPKSVVILIGIVCCILFLAEGTILDWSGIFLIEFRQISPSLAGMGIACFSVAMTFGRLTGDTIVSRLGARKVINVGSMTAISGFLIVLHINLWQVALVGYVLIGLGCANIVPIMFSATGRQTVMSQAMAVTAVSTLGYVGVLAGPALVGFSADIISLPVSLHIILLLLGLAWWVSRRIPTE